MSDPLFKVGERVGLVSVTKPHLNGEYVVESIVDGCEPYVCRVTDKTKRGKDWVGYGYLLSGCITMSPCSVENCEVPWDESALRKLNKPSKYSFEQLLSEIKSCNMNTIKA